MCPVVPCKCWPFVRNDESKSRKCAEDITFYIFFLEEVIEKPPKGSSGNTVESWKHFRHPERRSENSFCLLRCG